LLLTINSISCCSVDQFNLSTDSIIPTYNYCDPVSVSSQSVCNAMLDGERGILVSTT